MEKILEEKVKELPRIDSDLSPHNPANKEAARKLSLKYDTGRELYIDSDGCPVLDRYGPPLG